MGTLTLVAFLSLAAQAGPLTLDDALALAAKRNADLQLAREDQEAAAVEARAAYSGVLPRLDLSGAFGHQYAGTQQQVNVVPNPSFPGPGQPEFVREAVISPATDFGSNQLGLVLNWTVFDGLSSWRLIESNKTKAASASRQYDETTLRTAFETTRRFYEVVKQQRALQVRRDAATLSSELVQRADALFTAGRGTKADTYSARVNLGNDRIAVQNQAIVLARAQADLAFVLGLSSDGLEVVPPTTVTGNAAPSVQEPPPLPDLLTYARRARPLLAARRLAGEAADLDVSRAQGAWWPVVGLQGNYQRQSPDLTGSFGLFGDLSHQYTATAQVTLAWNLFAGGETRAGVDRAAVQARRAWTLAEQGEQTVFSELSVAREQVVALAGSVATAQEIQDAAEKALRFARERLEAGVGSQLEVRDAVLKLEDARLTWINTVVDLVVARADLNRAAGGSL